MAKINEKYEAVVVFSSKSGEENVKALTEKFDELIKANATDTPECLTPHLLSMPSDMSA